MHIWFWAWLLLTGIFAVMSFFDREHYTLPWALGAASAALLVGLGAPLGWEWAAFLAVSTGLLVGIQLFKKPGRKSLKKAGRRAA